MAITNIRGAQIKDTDITTSDIADGAVTGAKLSSSIALPGTPTVSTYTVGYRQMPQNSQAGAYTLVLTDDGKHIYCTGGTTATITIPANSSVALPVGTVITIVNNHSGSVTISGPTNSLQLASGTLATTRTLATKGMATLIEVNTDLWFVAGSGVT